MTAPSDKLPEWPADAHKIYADGNREEQKIWAIADYWESRCRLAVNELEVIADGRSDLYHSWQQNVAVNALEAIGPLPERDQ